MIQVIVVNNYYPINAKLQAMSQIILELTLKMPPHRVMNATEHPSAHDSADNEPCTHIQNHVAVVSPTNFAKE